MPKATADVPPTLGALPAGFWQRYAAWSLDAAVLAVPTLLLCRPQLAGAASAWERFGAALSTLFETSLRAVIDGAPPWQAGLGMLEDPALARASESLGAALQATLAWPLAVFVLLSLCWQVGFEHSAWRGSPGKHALGLQVTDGQGALPSWPRSIARFLAGGLSWLTLNIGHAMAAIPPAHLALHDRLSGTRVIARRRELPAWAKAWVWLQLAAGLAAWAWLLWWLDAAMQAALARSFQ